MRGILLIIRTRDNGLLNEQQKLCPAVGIVNIKFSIKLHFSHLIFNKFSASLNLAN
jgi:hypothetical protein